HDHGRDRCEEGTRVGKNIVGEKPRQTRGDPALDGEDRLEAGPYNARRDRVADPAAGALAGGEHVIRLVNCRPLTRAQALDRGRSTPRTTPCDLSGDGWRVRRSLARQVRIAAYRGQAARPLMRM